MAVVYSYAVKYNGKYYPPNTPIDDQKPAEIPAEPKGEAVESKPKKGKVKKDGKLPD